MSRSRPRVVLSDPFHDEIQIYANVLEFVGFDVIALTEPDLTRAVARVRELQPTRSSPESCHADLELNWCSIFGRTRSWDGSRC